MKMLLTGFEPFGSSAVNASEQVARAIGAAGVAGIDLRVAVLPVERVRGPAALLRAVADADPDAVLCLGQASRRATLSIERVAVNLLDFNIADNAGLRVTDESILHDGPAAYFATLPVRSMLHAARAAGVPAELSLSAGAFLCNQVLFELLHDLTTHRRVVPAGFVHLPALPAQAAEANPPMPSMSLDTMVTGVTAMIVSIQHWLTQPVADDAQRSGRRLENHHDFNA